MPGNPISTGTKAVEVQLARIEGTINQVRDGQRRTETDMLDIKTRLNGHSERLRVLESINAEEIGATKARAAIQRSATVAIRILWAVLGSVVAAVAALVATQLGLGGR